MAGGYFGLFPFNLQVENFRKLERIYYAEDYDNEGATRPLNLSICVGFEKELNYKNCTSTRERLFL